MKKHLLIMAMAMAFVATSSLAWGYRISSLPYTINTSGEYHISGSLTSSSDGIIINVGNVTIDLQGNTISGTNHTGNGIATNPSIANISNIEIKNGTVTGFHTGVTVYENGAHSARALNLRITDITGEGASDTLVLGPHSLMKDCTVGNNNDGPSIGQGSLIVNNVSYNNQGSGIMAYGSAAITVIGNTIFGNGTGIEVGVGSTVKNNSVYGNVSDGIVATDGFALIDGNAAYNNCQGGGGCANIATCTTCSFGTNLNP